MFLPSLLHSMSDLECDVMVITASPNPFSIFYKKHFPDSILNVCFEGAPGITQIISGVVWESRKERWGLETGLPTTWQANRMEWGKSLAEGSSWLLNIFLTVNWESISVESNGVKGKIIQTYIQTVFWKLLMHLHQGYTCHKWVWQRTKANLLLETQTPLVTDFGSRILHCPFQTFLTTQTVHPANLPFLSPFLGIRLASQSDGSLAFSSKLPIFSPLSVSYNTTLACLIPSWWLLLKSQVNTLALCSAISNNC